MDREGGSAMPGTVTVGWTSIAGLQPAELDALVERLPPPEQARARDLRLDEQRARFVVGRALLRAVAVGPTVLDAVELAPADLVIDIGPAGEPLGVGALAGLYLTVAHSGDCVLAAVASRKVGVDVQQLRDGHLNDALAARVCSAAELAYLDAMPELDRLRVFMTVWTRKEAYGKALGVGLDFVLNSVTVAPELEIRGAQGSWQVRDVAVDDGYAAAVVAEGRDWQAIVERVDRQQL
jgi:4'-phosphopantetheinyl transferase